jgi:hypothetical protein
MRGPNGFAGPEAPAKGDHPQPRQQRWRETDWHHRALGEPAMTNATTFPTDMTPIDCKRIGANQFEFTLASPTGGKVTFTMTTGMVVETANLAVAAINAGAGGVMKDLKIF